MGEAPTAAMSVMSTPSSDHLLLPLLAPRLIYPDCWPDCDPPTLMRSMAMLGTRSSMTHGSRAEGMLWSVSRSNVVLAVVLLVSTIGLALSTVTVSWTLERSSCWLTFAVKPIVIWMPSRTTDLKPGSSNSTL
jgi:hypothetical protein